MTEVEIKNLKVEYVKGKVRSAALKGLSAVFAAESFNAIVGYSGCGKTTLLRAIAGLIDYDGEILFDKKCVDDLPAQKRNLAYVSQQYNLYSNLTIFDNIAFPMKLKGADSREISAAVKDVAEKLGITCCLTRRPKHISGGQQQRAAIARALVKRPSLLLLDEPLSNVDPQLRDSVRAMLRDAAKSLGCTTIYVTHDFKEAMAIADCIYVMNDGVITTYGKPADVYKSNDDVVKALRGKADMLW